MGPAAPYLTVIHVCRQPRPASLQPLHEEQAEPPARSPGGHRRSPRLRGAHGCRHHPPPCLFTAEGSRGDGRAVHAGNCSLVGPRRYWLPPCWETGKTTTPSRPSRRAARRLVLAGRANYISQEATGAPLLRRSNSNCCFVGVLGFFRVCLFACLFVFSLTLAPFHGCSAATPMAPER